MRVVSFISFVGFSSVLLLELSPLCQDARAYGKIEDREPTTSDADMIVMMVG